MSHKLTSIRPPTIRYRPPPSSTLADPYDTSLLPKEITLYRTLDRGPAQYRAYIATAEIRSSCGFSGQSAIWAASEKSMRDLKDRSRILESVTVTLSDFEPTNTSQDVMDENGGYQLTDIGMFYEQTWKIGRMKANVISATFKEADKVYEVKCSEDATFFKDPVFKGVKVTIGGVISGEEVDVDGNVVLRGMVESLLDGQE